ncbi:MAG: hypothetical protein ACLRZH_03700 [Ruthenibacterium lactatiformans]
MTLTRRATPQPSGAIGWTSSPTPGAAWRISLRQDGARAVAPERVTGELRRTDRREYALFLRGERKSLATDFCEKDGLCTGTVCYTVQDGHAYATTAHKRFYYTNVSQAGNVLLDTAAMPAGTRITAYIIGELGCMTVAGLTL